MSKPFKKIKNPTLKKILTNKGSRARAMFILSILGTFAFAVFNAVFGILYKSIWYGSLAIYHIFLILLKILLVVFGKYVTVKCGENKQKLEKEQWRIYLINGIWMLALDLALTVSIIQMATNKKPGEPNSILAIATAAYAFFRIISSTINAIRNIKTNDIMLQVIRNISLIAAIVSMLALTSTMISTFGDFESMHTMLFAISVIVSALIILISVYMIIKGAIKIRRIEKSSQTG